jgi:hypothetical protein
VSRPLHRLVRIAKYDLPRPEGALETIASGNRAAFHGWLTDPVLESEGLSPIGQHMGVLAIDHLDALYAGVCLFDPLE